MSENMESQSVLIVDDDKFLLNMYALKFKKAGFSVDTALSGADALSKIKEGKNFDILIVDIIMPVMDGIEFIQNLRKDNLCKSSTIVVLTNQGDSADIEKSKSLQVDGYIVKATSIPSEVVDEVVKLSKKHKS